MSWAGRWLGSSISSPSARLELTDVEWNVNSHVQQPIRFVFPINVTHALIYFIFWNFLIYFSHVAVTWLIDIFLHLSVSHPFSISLWSMIWPSVSECRLRDDNSPSKIWILSLFVLSYLLYNPSVSWKFCFPKTGIVWRNTQQLQTSNRQLTSVFSFIFHP